MGKLVRAGANETHPKATGLRFPYGRRFESDHFLSSSIVYIYQVLDVLFSKEYSETKSLDCKSIKMTPPNKSNSPAKSQDEKDAITTKLESKAKETLTVLWHDLPTWQQDNQHIHSGYRPASDSYTKSLSSLTHLHNESVNIYTHLIGAFLALLTGLYTYSAIRPRYELAMQQDVLVFLCFFAGAVACLGMSAAYHTISNHSERVAGLGNKLDYLGYVEIFAHVLCAWGSIEVWALLILMIGLFCLSGAALFLLFTMGSKAIWSG